MMLSSKRRAFSVDLIFRKTWNFFGINGDCDKVVSQINYDARQSIERGRGVLKKSMSVVVAVFSTKTNVSFFQSYSSVAFYNFPVKSSLIEI